MASAFHVRGRTFVVGMLACAAGCLPRLVTQSAILTSSDVAGIETIAVDDARDGAENERARVAVDQAGVQDLWRRFHLVGPPPAIDFSTHILVAWVHRDDGCFDELTEFVLSAEGKLKSKLRPPTGICAQLLKYTIHVAAVARVSLPRDGVVFGHTRARFHRMPPAKAPAPRIPDSTGWSSEAGRGVVEVPPLGQVRPAALDDGTPVWLVHHADDTIDVLAGDVRFENGLAVDGLRTSVAWSPCARRFNRYYDERGVYVLGRATPPLDRYELEPVTGDPKRVRVGRRIPGTTLRVVAPKGVRPKGVDCPDENWPRQNILSMDEALRRPDGAVVIVDAALVRTGSEPTRMCNNDREGTCSMDAPTPEGLVSQSDATHSVAVIHGPLLARLHGGRFSEVTWLGGVVDVRFPRGRR